jgi:molybdenum cofactor guanylyltransferase
MQAKISPNRIGAVILAGGRGARMGGVDKGLQSFRGQPLFAHALTRLRGQTLGAPGLIAINANRNLALYEEHGLPVWPDTLQDYAGPLAGFLAALDHCAQTPNQPEYLLTVPCDSPLFPLDLLERLAGALADEQADIAMASAPEVQDDGSIRVRAQPVFCLMRTSLRDSLQNFIEAGGRKIDTWTGQQREVLVAFDGPQDDPRAFLNTNTLSELQELEQE